MLSQCLSNEWWSVPAEHPDHNGVIFHSSLGAQSLKSYTLVPGSSAHMILTDPHRRPYACKLHVFLSYPLKLRDLKIKYDVILKKLFIKLEENRFTMLCEFLLYDNVSMM